jgi:hypothetical protein
MSDVRTIITEDWQRDAVRVVMVNHHAHLVALMTGGLPGSTPMLRMMPYDPEGMTGADEQEVGILLPLAVARELHEALGRHFGIVPEPASRELVDVLKDTQAREAERVDHLIGFLTKGPAQ